MLGAIATALSGGSFAAAFVCGLTFAAKSAVTGAVMGAVIGGLSAAFSGENVLEGALSGFADGFYDGFMWGGITAGLGNVIKPGSFCFVAGTKVLTDRGHKNIEDIEVGDLVLAYDEETGLYYLNSRYYDPETGRFISPDRLENLDPGTINGLNLYVYAFANPVMVKHEYAASEMGIVPCSTLIVGSVGGDGNTTDTSWFSAALGVLKTIVGAQSDIKSALQYMRAKGIFTRFAWATKLYFNLPIAPNSWNIVLKSSSKLANFGIATDAIFKKIVAGNAKAGAKALIGSFGKVVGITAAINAVFNLVESGFNVTDPNVWIDTAIDTAIGVASYYLAAGMMAGIGALFFAGSLPGVVMMVGVVVLSWVIENMIRWIIGYQD